MSTPTYISNRIISDYFTAAPVFISEHTGSPGATGVNEVGAGVDANYARQEVTLAKSLDGSIHIARNSTDVSFPAAAGGSSYSVTHLGVWDAAAAGNLLATLAVAGSGLPVVAGTINTFAINDIVIRGE